jgi:hypothetical protein
MKRWKAFGLKCSESVYLWPSFSLQIKVFLARMAHQHRLVERGIHQRLGESNRKGAVAKLQVVVVEVHSKPVCNGGSGEGARVRVHPPAWHRFVVYDDRSGFYFTLRSDVKRQTHCLQSPAGIFHGMKIIIMIMHATAAA